MYPKLILDPICAACLSDAEKRCEHEKFLLVPKLHRDEETNGECVALAHNWLKLHVVSPIACLFVDLRSQISSNNFPEKKTNLKSRVSVADWTVVHTITETEKVAGNLYSRQKL